ncbi:MAG: glycoside hydrolase family 172 protein [Planctomycetota bacterium]
MKPARVLALVATTMVLTACTQGPAHHAIDDLSSPKGFKAMRASSADPTGKNGDARGIAPGETLVLADVKGSGRFTHLWTTIASPSPDHLRELVIRMTWDDAATPAVECPVGDFFAQGPGKYVEFASSMVSVGGQKALNCYWPMPFKRHAVITVTNEGEKKVDAFYYNFDYQLEATAAADTRYFHTQYRNEFPAPLGRPLTVCETKGAGHFVGTVFSVLANSDGWWGEGDDNFFVDGNAKADLSGTGTEDYFCGAWDFGHAYWTPYFGVTFFDNAEKGGEKRSIQNTVYRWHVKDAVAFTTSLLFTMEHGRGGWDHDRKPLRNHYTTLGLYYVDHPERDGAAIPAYKDRVPELLALP